VQFDLHINLGIYLAMLVAFHQQVMK